VRRNPLVIQALVGGLVLIVVGLLLAHTKISRTKLQEETKALQQNIATVTESKTALEQLEQMKKISASQEKAFTRAIPLDEKEPFSFLKELTLLAQEEGAQGLTLSVQPRKPETPSGSSPGRKPSPSEKSSSKKAGPGGSARPAGSERLTLFLIPIEMDFEIEFPLLINFMKRLSTLGRLITVQGVKVVRLENASPRQKVTLTLVAYTQVTS
jgi:hypothetical protein